VHTIMYICSAYKPDEFWTDRITHLLKEASLLYFNVSVSHMVVNQILQQFRLARRLDILHETFRGFAQSVHSSSKIIPQVTISAPPSISCPIQARY
jgi:hypothetical protein